MADLLLELLSEEIPARMQRQAADDLRKLVTDALVAQGFLYEGARIFVTPRRLTLAVQGLPKKGQDVREERKGPRVGAPEAAVAGFLKSAGLPSLDQAKIVSDPKKGDSYVAVIEKPGRATAEVIAEIVPTIMRTFPWPKSMRWGAESASGASFRWVRPLRSILCTFGDEHEEPEVVRFEVGGISSSNVTYGHRFMSDGQPIVVRRLEDYLAKLETAKVIADPERRKDAILHEARQLCFAQGFELVEDEGLAAEVAGLVEWPVPLMGSFEEEFLAVPQEAVRLTIRANQKCFVVRRPPSPGQGEGGPRSGSEEGVSGVHSASTLSRPASAGHPLPVREREGSLAARFIATANTEAADGGETIVAGNARVIRARLSDARFFFETDRKVKLEERLEKLKSVRFHEKLGTQWERVERIAALAEEIAPQVGADPKLAREAATLAKADLATEMVGEFPELQGLMGRYYAALEGHEPEVCAAIEEHYKPLGPGDRVPTTPVSIAVALADKLDTLVGFWAIDEKPTGSKDPYALRRAALGVIRLVVENGIRLDLTHLKPRIQTILQLYIERQIEMFSMSIVKCDTRLAHLKGLQQTADVERLIFLQDIEIDGLRSHRQNLRLRLGKLSGESEEKAVDLLAFFHDRLKVMLREQGARHDLVDAVLGAGAKPSPLVGEGREGAVEAERGARESGATVGASSGPSQPRSTGPLPTLPHEGGGKSAAANDDLLSIVNRVHALSALLATEDGANLLAATKRAANILRAEEKKDGAVFEAKPDLALLREPEEKALAHVLDAVEHHVSEHLMRDDYEGAMKQMAALRPAVDSFFDRILVNAPEAELRVNRLRLLAGLRRVTAQVADFGKVGG